MTLRLAIIADDLTGALDTLVPFAGAGFMTAAAVHVGAIEEALATSAEIVAVSTASRALSAQMAHAAARLAAEALRRANPEIVFKKIDSRLKGNVATETAAIAAVFGSTALLVMPAVPDQGRWVVNGHVVGHGVDRPLPIDRLFADVGLPLHIVDVASHADLPRALADGRCGAGLLAVGARGLGKAFADHLGHPAPERRFASDRSTLFAIGSRDPITEAQIDFLSHRDRGLRIIDGPGGRLPDPSEATLPLVLRCTGALHDDPRDVAARFAGGTLEWLEVTGASTLFIGGGDTALAIFDALGVNVLRPIGEMAPGVPVVELPREGAVPLRCAMKSGGFGAEDVLARLVHDEVEGEGRHLSR